MGNLILSRKCGQKITIGNDVVLTVADIRGDKVKLAFEAPESVRILRSELIGLAGETVDTVFGTVPVGE